MLPLKGYKVVDLSTIVLGPYASQILADYGADVIKVEAPEGDSTRQTGPATEPGMASMFLGVNRNKRSVVLDLKKEESRAALQQVLSGADVLMHNIRPQKLAALGLEPAAVLARHPRLVYASLNGFASHGPYGGKPAYDDIVQGLSGSAALMQRQTGTPSYFPTIAADKTCAHTVAHAILAALLARERTGEGCHVEIPMFETMVAFNLIEHHYGRHFSPPLAPPGYPRVLAPWRRPYQSRDGYVCVMPYTTVQWQKFFAYVGASELAKDPRFADMAQRTRHIEALYQEAGAIIAQRSTAEWLAVCAELEIPAGPVNQLEDLPDDPHLQATGYFAQLKDPAMGQLSFPGVPVTFNGARPPVHIPPRLGQHTLEVLTDAGVSPELAARLASSPHPVPEEAKRRLPQ